MKVLKRNGISDELLNLLCDFLSNRKQRISTWTDINARVPQGSILGPLFCSIYINDLADELSSNANSFANDTSLFSVVHNRDSSAAELNNYLVKIGHWAQEWKMSFNPDPSKQVQEAVFSRKVNKDFHPPIDL